MKDLPENYLNQLLEWAGFADRISDIKRCNPLVYINCFESLFGEKLLGVHRYPSTRREHELNCKTLINALSTRVLKLDLSHISPDKVVAGDENSIADLLEIFIEVVKLKFTISQTSPEKKPQRSHFTNSAPPKLYENRDALSISTSSPRSKAIAQVESIINDLESIKTEPKPILVHKPKEAPAEEFGTAKKNSVMRISDLEENKSPSSTKTVRFMELEELDRSNIMPYSSNIPSHSHNYSWEPPKRTKTKENDQIQLERTRLKMEIDDLSRRSSILRQSLLKDESAAEKRMQLRSAKKEKATSSSNAHNLKTAEIKLQKFIEEEERQKLAKKVRRDSKTQFMYRRAFSRSLQEQRESLLLEKQEIREKAKQQRKQFEVYQKKMEDFFRERYQMLAERNVKQYKDRELSKKAQESYLKQLESELKDTMERQLKMLKWKMDSAENKAAEKADSRLLSKIKPDFFKPSAYIEPEHAL